MKLKFSIILLLFLLLIPFIDVKAAVTASDLKGRILLQVESKGEAWYVNPKDSKRYYMANGDEAFLIMKTLGIGISNKELDKIKKDANYRKKFIGKIFLQVESHGEAYYISFDGRYNYLKDGKSAYEVMRKLGLGISNKNLEKVAATKMADTTNKVINCGSITYEEMVFNMFGNSTSTESSTQSKNSIKCINNALVNCLPAKFMVKGTNVNPAFPDQKDFKVDDWNIVVSKSKDNSKCMINECAVTKKIISNFYKVHGQETIFTLINPAGDVVDPVTKEVLKNVCPLGKNPYK